MKYLLIVFALMLTAFVANTALAANCTPIYGGGTNAPCATPSATANAQPVQPKNTIITKPTPPGFAPQGNQTKGGLVYPSQTTRTTPATGPESISLLILATSGLFGVMFRKIAANA